MRWSSVWAGVLLGVGVSGWGAPPAQGQPRPDPGETQASPGENQAELPGEGDGREPGVADREGPEPGGEADREPENNREGDGGGDDEPVGDDPAGDRDNRPGTDGDSPGELDPDEGDDRPISEEEREERRRRRLEAAARRREAAARRRARREARAREARDAESWASWEGHRPGTPFRAAITIGGRTMYVNSGARYLSGMAGEGTHDPIEQPALARFEAAEPPSRRVEDPAAPPGDRDGSRLPPEPFETGREPPTAAVEGGLVSEDDPAVPADFASALAEQGLAVEADQLPAVFSWYRREREDLGDEARRENAVLRHVMARGRHLDGGELPPRRPLVPPTPTDEEEPEEVVALVREGGRIRLRETPWGPRSGLLPPRSRVRLIASSESGWVEVESSAGRGHLPRAWLDEE